MVFPFLTINDSLVSLLHTSLGSVPTYMRKTLHAVNDSFFPPGVRMVITLYPGVRVVITLSAGVRVVITLDPGV